MLMDRMTSEWDAVLEGMDLTSPPSQEDDDVTMAYSQHVHTHNMYVE